MNELREKIKNRVKERKEKIIDRIDSLKFEMRKRFTIVWLLIIGLLLIFQGFVRFLPKILEVPEYVAFFIVGGIVLVVAIVYYFKG